eukprot:scaffold49680_cov45-Phaeocystis_antarctica.AAC.1
MWLAMHMKHGSAGDVMHHAVHYSSAPCNALWRPGPHVASDAYEIHYDGQALVWLAMECAFMWLAMEPPTSMTGDAITEAKVSYLVITPSSTSMTGDAITEAKVSYLAITPSSTSMTGDAITEAKVSYLAITSSSTSMTGDAITEAK